MARHRMCSSLIICMQVLFAHLVYGDCSKIKIIILISYLRARRFQWYKMNGFLDESHLFAFNTLRCLLQILFLFYQPSVELELWKRFHVFKKVRNISRFD